MLKKTILLLSTFILVLAGCSPAAVTQEVEPVLQQPTAPASTQAAPAEPMLQPTATPGEAAQPIPTQSPVTTAALSYPIVDTGQGVCYDNARQVDCPQAGAAFFGQDAQYAGNQPRYQDNGDGTVTDLVTGLMWQQDPGEKMTYAQALAGESTFNLAGYTDWRLPTIKELYSLILFSGVDPSSMNGSDMSGLAPFIDGLFAFEYGDTSAGERIIDSQFATRTKYVSTTMNGNDTMFGVNFADGRIKGYPAGPTRGQASGKLYFVLYVRGNPAYGVNAFVDNGDGTISDAATGLIWMQADSGSAMNWEAALAYCENLDYAAFTEWRLPDVKELQSIVDYSRSPDTTGSAAIDPLFSVSAITNEAGQADYPFYWSSTTHAGAQRPRSGGSASYVSFGRALGYMNGEWMDVHGAGAQRSDPKSGDAADWPTGHGPQGDAIRIANHVRCVRSGGVALDVDGSPELARSGTPGEAQATLPAGAPGQGGQPPLEAIKACQGLSVGAACQFTTPHGLVTGTCALIQEQLACVPVGGPPAGGQP